MGKGDKNNAKDVIATQAPLVQSGINDINNQVKTNTANFGTNYNNAVPQNLNNYNDVMNSYKQFQQGMPNSGALYSQFLGPKYAGATSTGPATNQPPTVDPNAHPVDQLFAKYGVKDTGPGSGVTDGSYWKQKYDSTGDPYYLGRLEDDLKGNGMDKLNSSSSSSSSSTSGPIGSAISGYQNFADTGGFSDADIANIRARSVAPIRSMADTNRQAIERSAAIRGTGYSPNTAAAIAKTARDADYSAGDTATNAEAMIAQMRQQGKLYGLQGLSSTGLADQSNTTANRGLDLSAINAAGGQQLGALQGMTSLYGATPGLTKTFGDQVLGSTGQGIQVEGLQGTFSQQQIDDAMKLGEMKGIPWKQILATTAGGIAIAATGGAAAPYVIPAVMGTYKS
jgi:hypothetical protein